jgi:ribosome biogenesis GTPase / thiamine phosphate phosphatase
MNSKNTEPLHFLGFDPQFLEETTSLSEDFEIGRIITVHKNSYSLQTSTIEYQAELSGKFIYSSNDAEDFPVVGDWVEASLHDDLAIIHQILSRKSYLSRKAIGTSNQQLIASNIDIAFIVQGCDRDFNLNRLDRYLTLTQAGQVEPVVLLNKVDLISEKEKQDKENAILARHPNLTIHFTSFNFEKSIDDLGQFMTPHKTYIFIGSSGVGKSTIINALSKSDIQKTSNISNSTQKGKHTTTTRELFILKNGSIVIDTPGMREIGVSSDEDSVSQIFSHISNLENTCRFTNCTHQNEPGCSILAALKDEHISKAELKSYQKLLREQEHFQSSQLERKNKDKSFGKMIKKIQGNKERF